MQLVLGWLGMRVPSSMCEMHIVNELCPVNRTLINLVVAFVLLFNEGVCVPSYLAEGDTCDESSARSIPHKRLRWAVTLRDSSQRKEQSGCLFAVIQTGTVGYCRLGTGVTVSGFSAECLCSQGFRMELDVSSLRCRPDTWGRMVWFGVRGLRNMAWVWVGRF